MLALSEPQGPVHLDLPEDVALARHQRAAAGARACAQASPQRPTTRIARAGELISAAKRPIAVLGSAAMRLADPAAAARA